MHHQVDDKTVALIDQSGGCFAVCLFLVFIIRAGGIVLGFFRIFYVVVERLIVIAVSPQRAGISGEQSRNASQVSVLGVVEVIQTAYLIKARLALFRNVFFSVEVSVVGSKTLANGGAELGLYSAHIRLREAAHKQLFYQTDGITRFHKLPVYKSCQIFFRYFRFLQIGEFLTAYQPVIVKEFPERAHLFHYVYGHRSVALFLIFLFPNKRPVFKAVVHNKTARNYMVYLTFIQPFYVDFRSAVHRSAQLNKPQI